MTRMNSTHEGTANERALLEAAGFASGDVNEWLSTHPQLCGDFGPDSLACSNCWALGQRLRAKAPAKAARNSNDAAAIEAVHRKERGLRERFLSLHVKELYAKVTARGTKSLRLEELMGETAQLVPGLTPDAIAMA